MTVMERAIAVLADAESSLRDLLGSAAKQGDYPTVVRLAEWARAVNQLAAIDQVARIVSNPSLTNQLVDVRGSTEGPNAPRKREGQYPKFLRSDEEIVMLGWSMREKKEYRHKASLSVLQSVANVIADKGSAGRVFTTDELLPLRNLGDGTATVPNYKVYVAISLLKHVGAIEQHGRSGYSIVRNSDFKAIAERTWEALPKL